MPDGRLICYQTGDIVLYKDGVELKRFRKSELLPKKVFGFSNVLSRFLRSGIRTAVAINEKYVLLSIGNKLLEMNIDTGEIRCGYECDNGVRPLAFTSVEGIEGFNNGIYFGGYIHNFEKNPVFIYRRNGFNSWDVVYSFHKGTINHVHNVISDPYRKCLWVFTGDFEDSAAIWRVTDNFNKVERVVCGDQKWRGCVAFATPEGVLYATDAPFAKNHIYLLKEDMSVSVVGDLSGSCIYGCQWKDKYVFSTVVEPDGRNETLLRLLFGWKRGAGIDDNYARIYSGNHNDGFAELYKEKKDLWPFIFQFGAFRFPSGLNTSDTLYFQPVATNKNDQLLLGLTI